MRLFDDPASAPKTYLLGTHRCVPPAETLRRFSPHMRTLGITRLPGSHRPRRIRAAPPPARGRPPPAAPPRRFSPHRRARGTPRLADPPGLEATALPVHVAVRPTSRALSTA